MEAIQIEAIRSCMSNMGVDAVSGMQANSAAAAADPAAVAKFQQLMTEPVALERVDTSAKVEMHIPFAERVAASFNDQQVQYQERLARINDILDPAKGDMLSQMDLMRLQYEIAAMDFQQNVVSKVIESASSAIQTLIKNS